MGIPRVMQAHHIFTIELYIVYAVIQWQDNGFIKAVLYRVKGEFGTKTVREQILHPLLVKINISLTAFLKNMVFLGFLLQHFTSMTQDGGNYRVVLPRNNVSL